MWACGPESGPELGEKRRRSQAVDLQGFGDGIEAAEVAADAGHAQVEKNLDRFRPTGEQLGDRKPQELVIRDMGQRHMIRVAAGGVPVVALAQRGGAVAAFNLESAGDQAGAWLRACASAAANPGSERSSIWSLAVREMRK